MTTATTTSYPLLPDNRDNITSSPPQILLMDHQQPLFPSTLLSPALINYSQHAPPGEGNPISRSTFEDRQQSMLKILDETLRIISTLSKVIEEEDHNTDILLADSSASFPMKFTFKFPVKRTQLKILNITATNSSLSGRPPPILISEDDPMTRRIVNSKLGTSMCHIERLKVRLLDSTVRILVTGDVNSGKSTLVNSLLGVPGLLPTDQQPCTSAYCEVVLGNTSSTHGSYPSLDIDSLRPVHAIQHLEYYAFENKSTYKEISLAEMQHLSAGNLDFISADSEIDSNSSYAWFRIFLDKSDVDLFSTINKTTFSNDTGSNPTFSDTSQIYNLNSDKHNTNTLEGTFPHSCSLIDSPGLNHDTLQTMSLFAKQDDIDILIFVINAANHLTLSVWIYFKF